MGQEQSPNQAGVYAVSIILLVFSTIAVALRFKVRRMKQTGYGADDWLILAALPVVWSLAAILIFGASQGSVGTHTAVDPETGKALETWQDLQIAEISWIALVVSVAAYGMIKLAVLFLYRRLFVGKMFNVMFGVAVPVIVLWTVSFFFGILFECGHDPSVWWSGPANITKYCSDYKPIWLGHAVADVVTDLMVLAIPAPIIWKLHLPSLQRVALIFIFGLGLISTAAACVRIAFVVELYTTTVGARDVRGGVTNAMVWGYVEGAVGIIAACLPTFKPLIKHRAIESMLRSVRSIASLGSHGSASRSRHQKDTTTQTTDSSTPAHNSYELSDFPSGNEPNHSFSTHIEGGGHEESMDIPENQIHAQTDLNIKDNRTHAL